MGQQQSFFPSQFHEALCRFHLFSYFLEEGFNRLHGDALSTTDGYFGTTVSPIFFAAGPGIKEGCETDRVIREGDVNL